MFGTGQLLQAKKKTFGQNILNIHVNLFFPNLQSTYLIKLSDNSNLNNILNDLIIDESYKIYELK